MAKHGTGIEWTQRPGTKGETANPIRALNKETKGIGHYCVHVSPACVNCYAERLQPRFRNPIKYRPQDRDKVEIFLDHKVLAKVIGWTAPRTIFWCSMTDIAAPWVSDEWLDSIHAAIALTPHHTHQILTKYPQRLAEYRNQVTAVGRVFGKAMQMGKSKAKRDGAIDQLLHSPFANCWVGTSVEDNRRAKERIPELLRIKAPVLFISAEPLLEDLDMSPWLGVHHHPDNVPSPALQALTRAARKNLGPTIDWIITGGESIGPGQEHRQRELNWDHVRSLRDQCANAGVAFFTKQGNKGTGWKDPIPADLQIHEWPEAA